MRPEDAKHPLPNRACFARKAGAADRIRTCDPLNFIVGIGRPHRRTVPVLSTPVLNNPGIVLSDAAAAPDPKKAAQSNGLSAESAFIIVYVRRHYSKRRPGTFH